MAGSTPNMYRVGDYVYFESSSTTPYQIRRIEELNKTQSGGVEAKVTCLYRRRDISTQLVSVADRHHSDALENDVVAINSLPNGDVKEETITNGDSNNALGNATPKLAEVEKHQLKHRELFMTRQTQTLPATHIRGKCMVNLLNETEDLTTYLRESDLFFYSLIYDPNAKSLSQDSADIRVGSSYQAVVPPLLKKIESDERKMEELETLVWSPDHGLSDREIDQYMIIARSVGTFARALDTSNTLKQPSLHMNAAIASRDITLFTAMNLLHEHLYNVGEATLSLVPAHGPILCRDELEEWSSNESFVFEEAYEKYGKDFSDIRTDFLTWKTLKNIIEYYYMWKTTDRFVQYKRIKAAENESKLKQVYIPTYSKPNPALIQNGGSAANSSNHCESCHIAESQDWYSWGPPGMQIRVCSSCWVYWKKYGGLKKPTGLDGGDMNNQYLCVDCNKVFFRQERLRSHRESAHKWYHCNIPNCEVEAKKEDMMDHYMNIHGLTWNANAKAVPRLRGLAFSLVATPLTRVSRRLCKAVVKPRHAARCPFDSIDLATIKTECKLKLAQKGGNALAESLSNKKWKSTRQREPLESVLQSLGVDVSMENKPAILSRDNMPVESKVLVFPCPSEEEIQQRLKNRYINDSATMNGGYPSANSVLGKRRGNSCNPPCEQVTKRLSLGVTTQGLMRTMHPMKANTKVSSAAPEDRMFRASLGIKQMRSKLGKRRLKRAGRKPFILLRPTVSRPFPIHNSRPAPAAALPSKEIVVLD